MVRSIDGETVAIAKIVSYVSQEEAAYHPTEKATWGRTRVGQEPSLWFPWVGMGKWGIRTVPSHLVPALG